MARVGNRSPSDRTWCSEKDKRETRISNVVDAVNQDLRAKSILLKLPLPVIERADLTCFEPSRDAVEVKGVVALTPSDGAFFGGCGALVGLALDAEVHDVVSADGALCRGRSEIKQRNERWGQYIDCGCCQRVLRSQDRPRQHAPTASWRYLRYQRQCPKTRDRRHSTF